MKGSHSNPIITGIIPTYVPIIAKNIAKSIEGLMQELLLQFLFQNCVPSPIVIPMMYGSASFHSNGILTRVVSNLSKNLSGSTAAG